jgi:hypothetical protein
VTPRLGDVLLGGAVYAGLLLAFFSLADPDWVARGESEAGVFFWLQVLDDGVLTAAALGLGRLRFPGTWAALGFRPVRRRVWLGLGAGGGVAAAALAWAVSAGLDRWGWPAPAHPVETVLGGARGPADVIAVLIAVALVAPFAEEAFFRGFAYRVLRARLGVAVAVAGTSLVFALVHGLAPGAWLPVLPVGLVLAALAEGTGSLWPGILAHAVVNALAVLSR